MALAERLAPGGHIFLRERDRWVEIGQLAINVGFSIGRSRAADRDVIQKADMQIGRILLWLAKVKI
jgi:hypothetical protein